MEVLDNDEALYSNVPNGDEEEEGKTDTDEGNDDDSNNSSFLMLKEYFQNIYFVTELTLCAVIAGLGHSAPTIIFRMSLHQRDIPYQETANGDVMLDLYLNREFSDQETIPDWLLIVLCAILPFFTVLIFAYFFGHRHGHDLHSSSCFFSFAFGCNQFITNFVKVYVGYWRPNFYSYCGFNEQNIACEAEDSALDDSRKSFPSGHASLSFCGMTLMTLFFLGKIGLYRSCLSFVPNNDRNLIIQRSTMRRAPRNNNDSVLLLLKKRILSILATLPMFLAVYISASRVHDDRHHPADVVAGSVIGMLCAVFSYGLWYPPISSEFSGFSLMMISQTE